MAKESVKKRQAEPQETAEEYGKLDEALTRGFRSGRSFVVARWKALVALIVIACVAGAAYTAVEYFAEQREYGYSRQLYKLTKDDNKPVDVAAIRALLADAEGSRGERALVKLSTEHVLERADQLESELRTAKGATDGDADSAKIGRLEKERNALLEAANEFASLAKRRFPPDKTLDKGNDDIAEWAEKVTQLVSEAKKPEVKRPKRRFLSTLPKAPAGKAPADSASSGAPPPPEKKTGTGN